MGSVRRIVADPSVKPDGEPVASIPVHLALDRRQIRFGERRRRVGKRRSDRAEPHVGHRAVARLVRVAVVIHPLGRGDDRVEVGERNPVAGLGPARDLGADKRVVILNPDVVRPDFGAVQERNDRRADDVRGRLQALDLVEKRAQLGHHGVMVVVAVVRADLEKDDMRRVDLGEPFRKRRCHALDSPAGMSLVLDVSALRERARVAALGADVVDVIPGRDELLAQHGAIPALRIPPLAVGD